ncbi:MAG: hypothetical protein KDB27_07930 [Planctomycetales bacterium]|nr:hypothetical protein [Planctomycetales bacterium]
MRRLSASVFLLCTICAQVTGQISAEKRVKIEVLTSSNASFESAHEWLAVLKRFDFDQVRMRSMKPSDNAPSIRGNDTTGNTVTVRALITPDNKLAVPGAKFSRSNTTELSKWLTNLRQPSRKDSAKESKADDDQLMQIRQKMAQKLSIPSKGEKMLVFLSGTRDWDVPVSVNQAAYIQQSDEILDDLSPLSRGTALAIAARQFHAAVSPDAGNGTLVITAAGKSDREWPIGWKPERPLPLLVPKMMDKLTIEVKDRPLSEVLNAIQAKVKIPFFVDHSSLARQRIDLDGTRVNIKPTRVGYSRILSSVLTRNLLSGEVRVDEAGTPFYWITTLKKPTRSN